MNATQYDIVKRFLAMGNSPKRIAKEFKASLVDVQTVASTHSYKQYQEKKTDVTDLFSNLFGGNL